MAVRRKRVTRKTRKSGGHPFLVLLFFICLITASAYVTDHMTNAPDASMNVAAVRHIFNDKEKQGLVPKEDQGTPESVKEKIKAALGKLIVVEDKWDEADPAPAETVKEEKAPEKETLVVAKADETTEETKTEESKTEAPKEEKKSLFDFNRILSVGTKDEPEAKEETKAESAAETAQPAKVETKSEVVTASAAPAVKKETTTAKASTAVKAEAPKQTAKAAPAEKPKTAAAKPKAEATPPKAKTIAQAKSSVSSGRLVVVIDDAGRDLASQHVYEAMGIPLTLAVMPNQVHTREAALSWRAHGLPVILHQPMESVSGVGMEKKVILTSMSDADIRGMLKNSLAQVPEAIGINNHQGSKATTDKRTMEAVMNELSHRGLFFFDSRTNSTTAADAAAKTYGVRYARNDLFVDNSANVDDICRMIREGADRAKAHGTYIIIGHCRPNTAEAFRQMVPKLQAEGIEFAYLSAVEK